MILNIDALFPSSKKISRTKPNDDKSNIDSIKAAKDRVHQIIEDGKKKQRVHKNMGYGKRQR